MSLTRTMNLEAFDGVIITGSHEMVSDHDAWMETLIESLRHYQGFCFGICFGHQILAEAFGGCVGINPKGFEIGTATIEKIESEDPLLGALPRYFKGYETHKQIVHKAPEDATILARNAFGIQALRFNSRCWGVQFHPEFNASIMRGYVETQEQALKEEGIEPCTILVSSKVDTEGILERFIHIL